MATISFFAGFEIKDEATALKILKVLKEPGEPVPLTPEEKELLESQEKAGKELLNNIDKFLKGL
ncbi:hypothetical protein [Phorcysia thermohydrogeniphila]|uniref:Uncharacterized protein n=1 Tax=Phorcysia thermohydrogeniphila TaxID=936138 RepID=A0A4R1G5U4_9BACT|nr:hypothetical protein [Phorcysia thermohydrogeniphila]TCK03317.1 hypothetical protein CLV27_1388 [Phorcysia thermohydrogeniphila]